MKKLLFSIILLINFIHSNAQHYQQQADYNIKAELNDNLHTLSATEEITYTNNFPESLTEVYILLYANAFSNKKSEFAKEQSLTYSKEFLYFKDEDLGYVDSIDFKVNGKKLNWSFTDKSKEFVKISLDKPLLSGEKIVITTPFNLKFPESVSRLGHSDQTYQVTQWYPKVAVYNSRGWHLLHYRDSGEFFADFGDYDVTLTLPENYVVGATGNLQTESEILWLEKKSKEQLNFNNRDENKSSKKKKTIRYVQKNVIDFAWFADKDYNVRKSSVKLPGSGRTVTTWAMFARDCSNEFQNCTEYIDSAIYYYSKFVGDYPFDNCTAVSGPMSAGGGMEYPTITIISVEYDIRSTVIHEVGHNWFQGILATDERRYAWMDEGINTFYEARVEKILNSKLDFNRVNEPNVFRTVDLNNIESADEMEIIYELMASKEYDQPINLTSESFCSMNYGGIVYGKTSYIFEHLASSLGAEKFEKAMQTYYENWKFKHPYPEDLQKIFLEQTGDSLNWFFDELINTTRKNDYAIRKVKPGKSNDSIYISIKNKGKIPAPITLGFIDKNQEYKYIWIKGFAGKNTIALPKQSYRKIGINAENSLYDVNFKNNFSRKLGIAPFKIKYGYTTKTEGKNVILWTPAIAYNKNDGFMAGAMFYNLFLAKRRVEYLIAPLYGTKSNQLAGFGDFRVNFFPYSEKVRFKIQAGIIGKKYSYDIIEGQNYGYSKIEPSIRFELMKKPNYEFNNHAIKFRTIYINEEQPELSESGNITSINKSNIIELFYEFERLKPLHKQRFRATFQNINSYGNSIYFPKVFAEYKIDFPYYWKNTNLNIRMFAGYIDNNNSYKYDFGIGSGSFTDYTYDNTYLGRSSTGGIAGAQIFIQDAGLKIPYLVKADSKIFSLNIASSFPFSFPAKMYFDIAKYKTNLMQPANTLSYSGGIKFSVLENTVEIYFPIINSSDIKNYLKMNEVKYYQQITFIIDFQKYDLFDIYKHVKNLM